MTMTRMGEIEDFLEANCLDEDDYDTEYMLTDLRNNNLSLDRPDNASPYLKTDIVLESIVNGQFRQAREQASGYGLDYDALKLELTSQRRTT